ncbi:MAG: nucleoside monophosphate kinase [Nitrospirota bacterium]|nr:nucleoside monophosphate kinase [Nitrospirota bacterium]
MTPAKSILIIGPTGAGKTPLGNIFAERGINGRRCRHFDFGNELRKAATPGPLPDGLTGDDRSFIEGVLNRGLLLENEHFHIAEKIIDHFLSCSGFREGDILVLNGLPRHTGQAKDMEGMAKVETLIVLECTAEDVFSRIRENSGGDRTGRTDDGMRLIREKLVILKERTSPLIDYYMANGCNISRIKVTVSSTAEEMYSRFISSPGAFQH